MRGIRGAITVEENNHNKILQATKTLLEKIITANNVSSSEMISIIFTATADLDKVYPALAAREMGFTDIPLMCYQELNIEDSLKMCIRVMIYINRDCKHSEIVHVYLRNARKLRPDLA